MVTDTDEIRARVRRRLWLWCADVPTGDIREVTGSELVDRYCSCFAVTAGPRGGLAQGMGEQGPSDT